MKFKVENNNLSAREQIILTELEFEHRSPIFAYIHISVSFIKINVVQVIMMLQIEE